MGKKSKALPGQSGGLYQPCRGWQLWGRQIPSNQQASADVKVDSMKGSRKVEIWCWNPKCNGKIRQTEELHRTGCGGLGRRQKGGLLLV
jgi:hypothetical protein